MRNLADDEIIHVDDGKHSQFVRNFGDVKVIHVDYEKHGLIVRNLRDDDYEKYDRIVRNFWDNKVKYTWITRNTTVQSRETSRMT